MLNSSHREPVVTVGVVLGVNIRTIEVQVVGIGSTVEAA